MPILVMNASSTASHPVGSGRREEDVGQLGLSIRPHRKGNSIGDGAVFWIIAVALATQ